MDFDLRSDLEKKKKPAQTGPNYISTSVRLRLGMLVAMLGLVFVAMHEASKPETWERMGFGSPPPAVENPEFTRMDVAPHLLVNSTDDDTPDLFESFWVSQYNQLSRNEKKKLFQLLRNIRSGHTPHNSPADGKHAEELIVHVRNHQAAFVAEHIESLPDSDKESINQVVTILTLDLAEDQKKTSLDSEAIDRVQTILDRQAYAAVEDRSSLSRPVEGLAWIRSWERLRERRPQDQGEPVSYLQLSGQPAAYRGHMVHVAGTVRAAESIPLKNHDLGFESYKVLWIKPDDSNRTPYCVYVRALPAGFPDPGQQFLELREPVVIDGLFFKLRSYVTADEDVEICPLLMADTFAWNPRAEVVQATQWTPSVWMLILFFVGMPIVAILLAVAAYRSTTMRLFEPGQGVQKEIKGALADLQKSPSVKTDRERVNELYRMDANNE